MKKTIAFRLPLPMRSIAVKAAVSAAIIRPQINAGNTTAEGALIFVL